MKTKRKKNYDAIYTHEINVLRDVINNIKIYMINYLIELEDTLIDIEENKQMSTQQKLTLLINEGKNVFSKHSQPGTFGDFILHEEYVAWIQQCKIFLNENVHEQSIIDNFSKYAEEANGNGEAHFTQLIGTLLSLNDYDFSKTPVIRNSNKNTKIEKIFISHASADFDYVDALITLLNDIGVEKSDEHIFCSSLAAYGIPNGEDIYEYLKKELENKNIMVLFVLSHNYYQSPPCLNEMGAAWMTSKDYNTVLTPNFDFKQITGAINPMKISFKMDDSSGLDKFRDDITKNLGLKEKDYKIWQRDRDKFLNTIRTIANAEAITLNTKIELEKVRGYGENEIEIQLRFVNVTERVIEFQYVEIELVDENGAKQHISLDHTFLDNFKLMDKENKIITQKITLESSSSYNARRNAPEFAKINFRIV